MNGSVFLALWFVAGGWRAKTIYGLNAACEAQRKNGSMVLVEIGTPQVVWYTPPGPYYGQNASFTDGESRPVIKCHWIPELVMTEKKVIHAQWAIDVWPR